LFVVSNQEVQTYVGENTIYLRVLSRVTLVF